MKYNLSSTATLGRNKIDCCREMTVVEGLSMKYNLSTTGALGKNEYRREL